MTNRDLLGGSGENRCKNTPHYRRIGHNVICKHQTIRPLMALIGRAKLGKKISASIVWCTHHAVTSLWMHLGKLQLVKPRVCFLLNQISRNVSLTTKCSAWVHNTKIMWILREDLIVFTQPCTKLTRTRTVRSEKGQWRGRKRTRCDLVQHPLDFTAATLLSVREPRSGHMSLRSRCGNDRRTDDSMWHMEIQQTDCRPTHAHTLTGTDTQMSQRGTTGHDDTRQHK